MLFLKLKFQFWWKFLDTFGFICFPNNLLEFFHVFGILPFQIFEPILTRIRSLNLLIRPMWLCRTPIKIILAWSVFDVSRAQTSFVFITGYILILALDSYMNLNFPILRTDLWKDNEWPKCAMKRLYLTHLSYEKTLARL